MVGLSGKWETAWRAKARQVVQVTYAATGF